MYTLYIYTSIIQYYDIILPHSFQNVVVLISGTYFVQSGDQLVERLPVDDQTRHAVGIARDDVRGTQIIAVKFTQRINGYSEILQYFETKGSAISIYLFISFSRLKGKRSRVVRVFIIRFAYNTPRSFFFF